MGKMEFRTQVEIPKGKFTIAPAERMLFVGSCFADNLGRRFWDDQFCATVNPYGVMYNPISIVHTIMRWLAAETPREGAKCQAVGQIPQVVILTLGTNHVYVLKETGEVVDNCEKRPARLFREETLSLQACVDALTETVCLLRVANPAVKVIITVSPIRYAKYGYPESMRSKATLLLAAHEVKDRFPDAVNYFPAYEIMNDELRDYRFFQSDMLHPSAQAVDYIHERFAQTYFSDEATRYVAAWQPLRAALRHRPFHPEADSYQQFVAQTQQRIAAFREQYPRFPNNPLTE